MADEFRNRLDAVLRRDIPDYAALQAVERLSGGASQETCRLVITTRTGQTRSLCLRRQPGGAEAPDKVPGPSRADEALLMQVARSAGVPEPQIYGVFDADDGLGEGFVMEWLDGETLGSRIARADTFADVRPRLAYACGEALARIHGIDVAAGGLAGRLATFTPEATVHYWWQRYQHYQTPQPMIDYTARWLLDHLPGDYRMTLVHSDFRNGNLLVDTSGIRAVLDWEMTHIGDPVRDLGWLCTRSWRFGVTDKPVGGFGDYADLLAGYEAVSGIRVDAEHLHFWEVFGSFCWAIGCLDMAMLYRTGPDRSVERAAIGRRSSECQLDCVNLLIPGSTPPAPDIPPDRDDELPSLAELLTSVRDFLRDDVMAATSGRTRFLARVAGNSLDIVLRESQRGPHHRAAEAARLRTLLGSEDALPQLRWRLVHALRDGSMALDTPGLPDYLRASVVNQIAIDQPGYSGLQQVQRQT